MLFQQSTDFWTSNKNPIHPKDILSVTPNVCSSNPSASSLEVNTQVQRGRWTLKRKCKGDKSTPKFPAQEKFLKKESRYYVLNYKESFQWAASEARLLWATKRQWGYTDHKYRQCVGMVIVSFLGPGKSNVPRHTCRLAPASFGCLSPMAPNEWPELRIDDKQKQRVELNTQNSMNKSCNA